MRRRLLEKAKLRSDGARGAEASIHVLQMRLGLHLHQLRDRGSECRDTLTELLKLVIARRMDNRALVLDKEGDVLGQRLELAVDVAVGVLAADEAIEDVVEKRRSLGMCVERVGVRR